MIGHEGRNIIDSAEDVPTGEADAPFGRQGCRLYADEAALGGLYREDGTVWLPSNGAIPYIAPASRFRSPRPVALLLYGVRPNDRAGREIAGRRAVTRQGEGMPCSRSRVEHRPTRRHPAPGPPKKQRFALRPVGRQGLEP